MITGVGVWVDDGWVRLGTAFWRRLVFSGTDGHVRLLWPTTPHIPHLRPWVDSNSGGRSLTISGIVSFVIWESGTASTGADSLG